jgi:hypothetical protein
MREIKELSRKRAIRLLAEYYSKGMEDHKPTMLELDIAVWLSGCLYKEIVGGGVQVFTFFNRQYSFNDVMDAMDRLLKYSGLKQFEAVQGGFSDEKNYLRVLTVDGIYSRQYLAPVYECLLAAEHPDTIQTDKAFLYVPESKYIDFPWVLEELIVHLDKPMDIRTLKVYPPEMEPIKELIEAVAEYAKLPIDVKKYEHDGENQYELSIIDPDRYGFFLQIMERPEQSDRAKDMLAQLEQYVQQQQQQQLQQPRNTPAPTA